METNPSPGQLAYFKGRDAPPLPTKDLLSWIFDDADYDPNKAVVIDAADPTRSLSLSQNVSLIQHFIAGLHHHGVTQNTCVLIHAFNAIHYIPLALSIIGAGGIFTGSNPSYTTHELTHHIHATSATYLIVEPETLPTVLPAARSSHIPTSHVIIFHPLPSQSCPEGFTTYTTLLHHGTRPWHRFPQSSSASLSKQTTACRYTSSGTSGLPKATINTHLNLIAQHEYNYSSPFYPSSSPSSSCAPTDHKIHLWSLPFFHAAVSPRSLTTIWKLGGTETAYIMRRFDVTGFVDHVRGFGVTELYVVPPMVVGMLAYIGQKARRREVGVKGAKSQGEGPGQDGRDVGEALRSIRRGWVGAAPLTAETQGRFVKLLGPGAVFTQLWGMTEANCIAARFGFGEGEGQDGRGGSVGWLCPGMEGKVVDVESGETVKMGEDGTVRGEMCVRGESVIPGYYVPEGGGGVNRKSWDEEGYYHTGDVVERDGGGRWYIVDRVKELIKVRGFQVAPPEVEGVLLAVEGVLDAAVVGVRDGDGEGEVCRAYVVRRAGWEGKVTENGLHEVVKGKLVRYKWLEGGVKFVESIPKTASGKILKRLLREEYERERRTGQAKL